MTITKYTIAKLDFNYYTCRKDELIIQTKLLFSKDKVTATYIPKWDIVYSAGDNVISFIWDEPELTQWYKKDNNHKKLINLNKIGQELIIYRIETRF